MRLLTSPIRPGVILIGKYLSALTYLFLLVLSTAPLVAVLIWLAGLDPLEIAGLYLLLLALAAGLCMLGLTCSVFFDRSQSSLAITYMLVLPLALVLLFCAGSFDGFFHLKNTVWLAAFLLAGCATENQAKLMAAAKVSKETAQQTALAKVPNGTIKPPLL